MPTINTSLGKASSASTLKMPLNADMDTNRLAITRVLARKENTGNTSSSLSDRSTQALDLIRFPLSEILSSMAFFREDLRPVCPCSEKLATPGLQERWRFIASRGHG